MAKNQKVYFLRRADGLVKIGYTTHLVLRVTSIEKSHGKLEVLRVIAGDQKRERQIHQQCRAFHQFGEWFRDCPELRAIMEGLEEGSAYELLPSDLDRAWADFEAKVNAEAINSARELVTLVYQRNGNQQMLALKMISEEYQIPYHRFHHLFSNQISKVSAAMLERIRFAIQQEKIKRLAELQAMLAKERADLHLAAFDAEEELAFVDKIDDLQNRLKATVAELSAMH